MKQGMDPQERLLCWTAILLPNLISLWPASGDWTSALLGGVIYAFLTLTALLCCILMMRKSTSRFEQLACFAFLIRWAVGLAMQIVGWFLILVAILVK